MKTLSRLLLSPPSQLFKIGVRLRNYLYDNKVLRRSMAPLPVVSIGNIVAGGAGKTQVILLLAKQLVNHFDVAIVSRGFRGKAEHFSQPLYVEIEKHQPHECGDEPWLLASRLPEAIVLVNKNRFKCALEAERRGAKLILLDDGMQHRQLYRDFEIVVIDADNPFGGGSFLPKGSLREDPKRLKKADLILYVGTPEEAVEKKITALSSAPQVMAKIRATQVLDLERNEIETLKEKSVALFCGIGNPQRFVKTVKELGAHVVATHFSPDHSVMDAQALHKFAAHSKEKGAKLLLCTEKDKVKLPRLYDLPVPIGWIRADLEIVKNRDVWEKTLSDMKTAAGILL